MDVSGGEIPTSSMIADDSSKEAVAAEPGPSTDTRTGSESTDTQTGSESTDTQTGSESTDTQTCSGSETKCRKSSRIKAKMSKMEAEAADAKEKEKYNLRLSSLVKRVQVEQRQSTPKPPKGKSKPPPLSKYRRRTANARERMRMKDINEGFEQLQRCLPEMAESAEVKGKKEKPTKYTILSLALNYIHALRDILGYPPVSDAGSGSAGASEDSDLGSDAASTRTSSVSSSPSSDDMRSNPSPASSAVVDLKDLALHGASSVSNLHLKDLACYAFPIAGSSGLGFRDNVTCSSPSQSDPSLSPSPPPLPLPDDCMDLGDPSLCLDVPIPLATLEECMDIL